MASDRWRDPVSLQHSEYPVCTVCCWKTTCKCTHDTTHVQLGLDSHSASPGARLTSMLTYSISTDANTSGVCIQAWQQHEGISGPQHTGEERGREGGRRQRSCDGQAWQIHFSVWPASTKSTPKVLDASSSLVGCCFSSLVRCIW